MKMRRAIADGRCVYRWYYCFDVNYHVKPKKIIYRLVKGKKKRMIGKNASPKNVSYFDHNLFYLLRQPQTSVIIGYW